MITKTIQLYSDRPDVKLETYLLSDSPELGSEPKPAVLICPGGAYLGTSDRESEPVALRFAAMGYHALVLRYSTFSYGEMKWFDNPDDCPEGNPNARYPGPVEDLARALLTIADHAEEWQLDSSRIAICGFSAGAHLCASYGVHWHSAWLKDKTGESPVKPAAVILGYPLTDYMLMKSYSQKSSDPKISGLWQISNMAVFGEPEPDDETLAAASPINYISEKTPPMFIWHTAKDGLVPAENSTTFATSLIAAGISCELHLFEEGDHGLALANAASAVMPEQIVPSVQPWIDLARTFLEKHLD